MAKGKKHTKRAVVGLILLGLSYGQSIVPQEYASLVTLTIFWGMFKAGVILVCESITLKLQNYSLINEVASSRSNIISLLTASFAGGVLLDAISQWIGKLWVYPYFSNAVYLLVFVPGFLLYWIMIAESYLAAKSLMDKLLTQRFRRPKTYRFEPALYIITGVFAIMLILSGLYIAARSYQDQGGYNFELSSISTAFAPFSVFVLLMVGVWFAAEYLEFIRHERSLIKDLLHHYYNPLFAILLGSVVLAFAMELVNTIHGYWVYAHWPYEAISVLSLPITMMFFGWPLHYIMFLSLFRATAPSISRNVWLRFPVNNSAKTKGA